MFYSMNYCVLLLKNYLVPEDTISAYLPQLLIRPPSAHLSPISLDVSQHDLD